MTSEKAISLLAACAVALAGLAIAVPAVAGYPKPFVVTGPESDKNVVRRYVSYRDLNLATSVGETIPVKRVRVAVRDACDEAIGVPSHDSVWWVAAANRGAVQSRRSAGRCFALDKWQ